MFLAAVLAHHTEGTPHPQPGTQALTQPIGTETTIRQSVREESQRRDTSRPVEAR
jgi:hypothetical protein